MPSELGELFGASLAASGVGQPSTTNALLPETASPLPAISDAVDMLAVASLKTAEVPAPPPSSMLVLFVRMFWMALGPLILSLLALNIWFTTTDLGFFVVLAGLLVARWAEFKTGSDRDGEATPAHHCHDIWSATCCCHVESNLASSAEVSPWQSLAVD